MEPDNQAKRSLIERWAHTLDALDMDAGVPHRITDQRLLVFVIRNNIGVILAGEAGRPSAMAGRRYRPELVWAAADLGMRHKLRGADEFARVACDYLGLESLEDGEEPYLDRAYALALRRSRRSA